MKVVYLSDIGLNEATGGSRVMTAHLTREDAPEIVEIGPGEVADAFQSTIRGRVIERFKRTRFSNVARRWEPGLLDFSPRELLEQVKNAKPDLLLTVAHGQAAPVAEHISRKLTLPLATVFHDWWPFVDQRMRGVNAKRREVLESQFNRIYKHSHVAFCVCQGMKDELGEHPNSPVLYPMPNFRPSLNKQADANGLVFYTGDMGYGYGELLRSLVDSAPERSRKLLRLYGNYSQWQDNDVSRIRNLGVLFDPISFNQLFEKMSGATALLVVSSFKQENAIYTRTSFPSKISSYAMSGSPIIFWAPEDSSPAKFCREYDAGALVTSPDQSLVWDVIDRIKVDKEFENSLREKSLATFEQIFDPENLQTTFLTGLQSISR